ncbi:TauD/TfdA family dioxygenase [Micromonospora sp. C95]|uniref:TauD/TfdA family dioxygenase n=1 Tax=Micromonospora sp. C95 TaxID=2824882 RepID=UPI001B398B44|nr:TauD/TfdA family dioxygenase [Micromonospora sp. C95]MBQ1026072.1 TauD/TfdA family dioxygenase [Micromonospora sp. C95]
MTIDSLNLLKTAKDVPTFDAVPWDSPVAWHPAGSGASVDLAAVREIVRRYRRHGFCIVQLQPGTADEQSLSSLAEALRLGNPFVPPLYRLNGNTPSAVSRISAGLNASTQDATHPSFGRSSGQRLHTDGTLQDIGQIRTTLLLCQSVGRTGGDTRLFNATAAYAELLTADLPAALALATPGSLVRRATVNGSDDFNAGPAFAVVDGQLVTRYSLTDTDRWEVPSGISADDLWRAVAYLERCAEDSAVYREFRLEPAQVLVLANARLSHGRTAYTDDPQQPRCMFRTLHEREPATEPIPCP